MAQLTQALADAEQDASAIYTGGGSTGYPSGMAIPTYSTAPVLDPAPLATPGVTITGATTSQPLPALPAPTPCATCQHGGTLSTSPGLPGATGGGGFIIPPGGFPVTLQAPTLAAPPGAAPLGAPPPVTDGILAWIKADPVRPWLLLALALLLLDRHP